MEAFADEQPPNCLEQSILGRFSNSLLSDPAAASLAMVANRLLQTHVSRSNLGSVRINAFKDHSILSRTSLKPTGPRTRAVTDPSYRFQRADLHLLD